MTSTGLHPRAHELLPQLLVKPFGASFRTASRRDDKESASEGLVGLVEG